MPSTSHRIRTRRSIDLAVMGARIAEVGPGSSHALLTAVADRARTAGLRSAAVDLLADRGAPDVVRARAFAVVGRRLAAIGRSDRVADAGDANPDVAA
jgi:hypothetical protein